jgi:hypothetical protein
MNWESGTNKWYLQNCTFCWLKFYKIVVPLVTTAWFGSDQREKCILELCTIHNQLVCTSLRIATHKKNSSSCSPLTWERQIGLKDASAGIHKEVVGRATGGRGRGLDRALQRPGQADGSGASPRSPSCNARLRLTGSCSRADRLCGLRSYSNTPRFFFEGSNTPGYVN